jgi:tetratricopeptide (TPR) repeat protein
MTVPEARIARASIPAIFGGVPTRNKNFTGRDDILARLRDGASMRDGASSRITAVLPERDPTDPLPQGVHGMGGVGKTAIAIEYAHRYGSDYDLVWWIPADQLPSVRGSLATLAARLNVDAQPAAGIDGLITAVLDALRRGEPYSRWLLIFDNADQPEDINDLIPRGPGDVLVTSRNHRWDSVINTVPMDVFQRAESKEFLRKRVSEDLDDADADRLAKELGDLPLALEQAGAMLSETGMPVDEYLRLLKEQVTAIMAQGKSMDYPYSMTAAWQLSVDALEERLPQALVLLRCCAFFGPEPIPRNMFREREQNVGTPVAEVVSNPIMTASAFRELARYALVTLDGGSVRVHRLIQALLRDGLTDKQRTSYRSAAHVILAGAMPEDPDKAQNWPRFKDLLPHVNADSTELLNSSDPGVRDLALSTMRYLHQSGDYASALALTERCIEQWTKDSGADNSDVLRAQRHLGNILRDLGRYDESYRVTQHTLERAQAVLGDENPTTLSLRTAFAADQRARGNFVAARRLDEQSRPLLETSYGVNDSRTLRLLSSLALDYGLNSDYRTAWELYEDAFRRMSPSGTDSTASDVLGAWIGISWTLRLLGQFQEAFKVGQRGRDFAEDPEGLGPEHVATLRANIAYTIVCRRIPDKRKDALKVARATRDLSTSRYGENHPETLAIGISLSNLLRTMSEANHAEALALAEETVGRYPRVYGPTHPYNFGCLSNLALLRRYTGDAAAAREIDERALQGLTDGLGKDHHFTLTVAMNLASDLAVLGLAEDARRLGEDIWPRLTALLGAKHPQTLGCAANLALDRMETGDQTGGKSLMADVLRFYEETQGPGFPDAEVAAEGRRLDPDFDPPAI